MFYSLGGRRKIWKVFKNTTMTRDAINQDQSTQLGNVWSPDVRIIKLFLNELKKQSFKNLCFSYKYQKYSGIGNKYFILKDRIKIRQPFSASNLVKIGEVVKFCVVLQNTWHSVPVRIADDTSKIFWCGLRERQLKQLERAWILRPYIFSNFTVGKILKTNQLCLIIRQ